MDAVVQQQMESAQRQADIAGTQRGAQAVRAGAFGGSRQAVENAEAARALASQKGQIQATGLQSAFERAQQQFNQEQATRLNAAQTLGQLGQQQFGQQMDITGQQAQFGGQQRQATQDILGAQYQDFLNQQRAPYDQLAFMTSMIRGTPMGQTTTMYQPPPSATSQLIGLGIAGAGAYGAYQGAQGRTNAAGGEVKSYAAGGIASLNQPEMAAMAGGMSDQQLQQTQGLPSITELARMTLAAEAQQRAQMRQQATAQQAMMQQQPQATVAEEQMAAINAMDQGLGGLDVPDDLVGNEYTAAGGGIVAFDNGGSTSPFGRFVDRASASFAESNEAAKLRNKLQMQYGPASAVPGLFYNQSDAERAEAKRIVELLPKLSFAQLKELEATGSAKPATTPAASGIAVDNRAALNRADAGIRSLPALTDAEKAAQAAVTTKPPATSAAPGAAPRNTGPGAAPAMPSGGIADLLKDIKTRETQLRTEATQASDIEAAGKAKERIELEAAREEAKKYGTEQEEKYKKRGERLEKDEKQNPYMSLIEAGLAMAAGESPNALKNIAVGAQQGLKGYQGRLEKVNEGRDGLEDAMFKLYNIRNDKVTAAGDKLRELGRAETEAKAKAVRSLSEISKGMFGEEIKVKTKEIDRAFDVWKTKYEQGQANIRAQAGRSPDQLALLTKYPAGTKEGDELRKNITFMKGAGRDDPILKDPRYKNLTEQLSMEEMMLSRQTDPAKKLATQERIADIQRKINVLTGGGSAAPDLTGWGKAQAVN
jgi:hypothetical protein